MRESAGDESAPASMRAVETFSVYYNVWGVACGGPLSGAWSLKNSAGTPIGVSPADMSATQAGYLDRLYWNCQ